MRRWVHHAGMKTPIFLALLLLQLAPAHAERASDRLNPFVEKHALAGAVTLVATRDEVKELTAVGSADIAAGRPMRTDSLFWIASQSKAMTAAALMMLVDAGKVNVEDPVEKYLPEFKGQQVSVDIDGNKSTHPPKHPITVRNILTHTSGLAFSSPIEKPTLDRLPLAERVASYAKEPLLFEPDSKYQYSNEGINTAGRIIEVVSGMPYEQFMDERLFRPLGMKDTTIWPSEEQVARLAKSYRPNATKDGLEETKIGQLFYPLTDRTVRQPMPAGGYFSTAADVARFCQMVLRGGELDGVRVLSEKAVQQMTTRQTPADLKESYGFGWAAGPTWAGHGGAQATNMSIDREHGVINVFLVQHAGFPLDGAQSRGAFEQAVKKIYTTRP